MGPFTKGIYLFKPKRTSGVKKIQSGKHSGLCFLSDELTKLTTS